MTVPVIIETILLVVALVYIVALLRSHADILRRLTVLEDARDRAPDTAGTGPLPGAVLAAATDVAGETLAGAPIRLALGPGSEPTLLMFLTSGCGSCAPLWQDLRDPRRLGELGAGAAIVAHGPERDSPARLRELAPPGVPLVVSDAAWSDYAVPASPHFVLTDGAGGVAGRGSALSFDQLITLLGDARADAGTAGSSTSERAARAEQALARAGIGAGHPSLYPSGTPGEADG